MKDSLSSIILAGGKSSRMGTDKSLLDVDGKPLITHMYEQLLPFCSEIIISANDPGKFAFLPATIVPDIIPGEGPLVALVSCLQHCSESSAFVIACDIPVVDERFLVRLFTQARKASHADAIVATKDGKIEPLFAVYRRRALDLGCRLIESGKRSMFSLLEAINVEPVQMNGQWYKNMNTPEQYREFLLQREP